MPIVEKVRSPLSLISVGFANLEMRGMKSFREGVDNNNMDLVILPMGILVMSLGYTKLHMKRESKKEMKSKLKS